LSWEREAWWLGLAPQAEAGPLPQLLAKEGGGHGELVQIGEQRRVAQLQRPEWKSPLTLVSASWSSPAE